MTSSDQKYGFLCRMEGGIIRDVWKVVTVEKTNAHTISFRALGVFNPEVLRHAEKSKTRWEIYMRPNAKKQN